MSQITELTSLSRSSSASSDKSEEGKSLPMRPPSFTAPELAGLGPRAIAAFPKSRETKDRISKNCLSLLKEILGNFELPQVKENVPEYEHLRNNVLYLHGIIQKAPQKKEDFEKERESLSKLSKAARLPPIDDFSSYRKAVRIVLCDILTRDSAYQRLKEYEQDPLIHFLHTASAIILHHSEGMGSFQQLGEELLGNIEDRAYSYADLASSMERACEGSSRFSIDNTRGRIAQMAHAPRRAFASLASEMTPLDYDPHSAGNYDAALGTFSFGGAPISISAFPNPANDPLFDAVNQRNCNLTKLKGIAEGKGPFSHHQFSAEGGGEKKKSEKWRRDKVLGKTQENKQLKVIAFSLDGAAYKGKGLFKEITNAHDFIEAIQQLRQGSKDSGFIIPEEVLTKDDMELVDLTFQAVVPFLERTEKWQSCIEKGNLSATLLLIYDAIISLKTLAKAAAEAQVGIPEGKKITDELPVGPTCCIACKQCIDRGAVIVTSVRMLVDALGKGKFELTREELHQYCGFTAGRALSVEGRRIKIDRLEALQGFIGMIADMKDQEVFLGVLRRGLRLPDSISFTPSHQTSFHLKRNTEEAEEKDA